jgi:hypothetical protein
MFENIGNASVVVTDKESLKKIKCTEVTYRNTCIAYNFIIMN